jgi:hypothetical protein
MAQEKEKRKLPVRNSIRILLINPKKELLLLQVDDPSTFPKNGSYQGKFWFTLGGEIEPTESALEAASRELYEETGIESSEVEFGPVVWFGDFELIVKNKLTHLKQQFIVATTKQTKICFKSLSEAEKKTIVGHQWFDLNGIRSKAFPIYPVTLKNHLPDILEKKYPLKPIKIDLSKDPYKLND